MPSHFFAAFGKKCLVILPGTRADLSASVACVTLIV